MAETAVQNEKKPVGRPKKPKAPLTPVTETPEFKAALDEAVSKGVSNILEQLKVAQNGESRPGDATWAEGLALAIAQLSHQGVGKAKPVDPTLLKQREGASVRMLAAIVDARARGDIPVYALRNKVYLDERLIDPVVIDSKTHEQAPTQIGWPGVPNSAMIPVNEAAKLIHKEFSDSIGVVVIEHSKHIKPEVYSVTKEGRVIRAASLATRPQVNAESNPDGVQVLNARGGGGKSKEINVLGTVAAPARVGANG